MAELRLPNEYHRQDSDEYCGAACAQMVLNGLGTGLLAQDDLYTQSRNQPFEPVWYMPPEGLTRIMYENDPRGPDNFLLYHQTDALRLTGQILYTLDRYKVPPIALVFDANHWVVVYGCEYVDQPGMDFNIQALYVNNPSPYLTNPVQHTTGDFCSTDGHISDIYIPRERWLSEYLTAVVGSPRWNGQFLAVCDPTPTPERKYSSEPQEKYFNGSHLLTPNEAAHQAELAVLKYQLSKNPIFNKHFKNVIPGTPSLVKRIDRMNDYYYIVPMLDSSQKIQTLVIIEALHGKFGEAGVSRLSPFLKFKPLSENEIMTVIGQTIHLKSKGTIRVFKEALQIYPLLVWRPCLESLSTFLPFHLVFIGKERFYVRLDGKVFTKLSFTKKGA